MILSIKHSGQQIKHLPKMDRQDRMKPISSSSQAQAPRECQSLLDETAESS